MDNSGLAEENEELRQFALDGMEMAKSAADLAGKGNALSVDLADKSDSIKKLLNENERLTQRLDAAQKEAQGLVEFGRNQKNQKGPSPYKSPKKKAV